MPEEKIRPKVAGRICGRDRITNVNRRNVLKTIGGSVAVGAVSTGQTAATGSETSGVANTIFAELGISFDTSEDVSTGDEYDSVGFYRTSDSRIEFSAIERADLELLKNSDAVVKQDTFERVPTTITRRQYGTLVTELNEQLQPMAGIPLSQSVSTPAIRIDADGDEFTLAVGGNQIQVVPGESETLEIDEATASTRSGREMNTTARITMNNHGNVDVVAENVLEGN